MQHVGSSSSAAAAAANSLQSCPTLCDPTDGSPSGSPVPGILQARTLEWAAIAFSTSSSTRDQTRAPRIGRVLATGPPGKSQFQDNF